jgi:transcription elongation factor Elf1
MKCLGCNYIKTAPVTLRDGRIVCSSCEAWRLECEARHVLTKPDVEKRAYLEAIGKKRGEAARQELREEMIALHRRKNAL